jgi:hypothetical protein
MQKKFYRYRLLLAGPPNLAASHQDLLDELDLRPHLQNPSVRWDITQNGFEVQFVDEMTDSAGWAKHLQEELWELSFSFLESVEGLNVQIVSVEPIDTEDTRKGAESS